MVRNNPTGDIYAILGRPDLMHALEAGLAGAQQQVVLQLDQAWPLPDASPYRARLAGDIARAYADAVAVLHGVVIGAYQSVPTAAFIPGVTPPGENPRMTSAERRSQAVAQSAAAAAMHLGFRNAMTVDVAGTRRRVEQVIADSRESGPWLVKWVCRKGPDGRPDVRVCDWCRRLDAMDPIPAGQEFPPGGTVGGRRPPRVYLDLLGPPRHPRCRCRIILVRAGGPSGEPEPGEPVPFVSAASIRSMPAERYQALREFHHAALHELGQVLQRQHREVGKR